MTDYKAFSRNELIARLESREKLLHAQKSSDNDSVRLLQELQVQQIELEMQNRDLREKQLQLEIAHDKYADLYDFAPVGYLTLDEKGIICEVNLTAADLLAQNRIQLLNKPFTAYIAKGKSQDFYRCLRQALLTGDEQSIELQLKTVQSKDLDVQLQMLAIVADNSDSRVRVIVLDISEKKRSHAQLLLFRQQIEQSKDAVYVIDYASSRLLDVNKSASNMLGYSREQLLEKSMMTLSTFFSTTEKWQELATSIKNNNQGRTLEDEHRDKDGRKIPVEISVVYQSNGRVILVASVRDISDRKRQERQLQEKNTFIQAVIDGISDNIMVINKDYSIAMMNISAARLINEKFVSDSSSPKCYEVLHHRSTSCSGIDYTCTLQKVVKSKTTSVVIHPHYNSSGEVRKVELTANPLKDSQGNIYAIIESAHDITSLLQTQQDLLESSSALKHQAYHDELTKLPNRLLLFDRLQQTIIKAQRKHLDVAVLFIDLDQFKEVNDSLGHSVGDVILIETAARLQHCVRESDTVARLGGDEFTIILDDIKDNDIITDITQKIIHSLQEAFLLDDHKLYVTCSIGISLYPRDATSARDLLRNADSAMYKAKQEGRNTYQFYTEDMTQRAFEHILMESSLRHALEHNELTVFYQPQINCQTRKVMGMEALVRWQHSELGMISPDRFIPLAEKTGLILPLGEQVFDIASKQMAFWKQKFEINGRMAINLSVKQLHQKDIVDVLSNILKKNNCKPQWIEFEITENYIMDDPEQTISVLQKLQNIGINIAIDDFGTGYSSLSYLKRMPIYKLKIDKSFIQDLMDDEDDRVIITSTILLAHNMKLDVIAEGVETAEQKDFILEQNCKMIQGYYYNRPVSAQEMSELLNSENWMGEK